MSSSVSTTESTTAFHFKKFIVTFLYSKGCLELVGISLLLSMSKSSVIGLVPDAIADRYARLHHGYTGEHCSTFDRTQKPEACENGNDDAQAAAAWANVALCIFAFTFNPVFGSLSDQYGRRKFVILSLFLECLPATILLFMLSFSTFHPIWYLAATSLLGMTSIFILGFAMISDVISKEFRAPAFGVFLASGYAGYAFGPSLPLCLPTDFDVAILALVMTIAALILTVFFLPETLQGDHVWELDVTHSSVEQELLAPSLDEVPFPDDDTDPDIAIQQITRRASLGASIRSIRTPLFDYEDDCCCECCAIFHFDEDDDVPTWLWCLSIVTRPFRDIAILNRNWTLRLLTFAEFLMAAIYSSDHTLVMYYAEDQLNVRAHDISIMFVAFGLAGVFFQVGILQPLIDIFGEKGLLILTFLSGTVHNFLYGVAHSKTALFWALLLSQFTKLNFPILSSLASKGAEAEEQGRVQGALIAVNSIGYALGPLSMEFVYSRTKDNPNLGPGFMFIYAAGVYFLGTIVTTLIPKRRDNGDADSLNEPLLEGTHSDSGVISMDF